ncbi:MAG TPA: fimbria/pilus periplasmic chaperone [Allosphingosinicella sp.]|nr:fimbria/pilus periplasmic chaperone [Allosphingosinicella sp.]
MRRNPFLALACGAAFLLGAAPAAAGTLQVNPVLVEINAGRRTATVTVRNEESTPVTIRAYPMAWQQADGEDRYEESSAVIVSPPIFTIPPGGSQLVRVGLRARSAEPQAYRLIIEEVPEASPGGGIRVALRLNLPFYSMIPPGSASDLAWSAARQSDGEWTLEAVNSGSGYVRLDAAAAQSATGIAFEDQLHFGTVLPGATRRWRIGREPTVRDRARFEQLNGAHRRDSAAAGRD